MRVWHAVWQGTEGTVNPVTRPLVKSLMKVLSFLMGRRRKVVPKAMEKLKPRCGWAESAENPQMILRKRGPNKADDQNLRRGAPQKWAAMDSTVCCALAVRAWASNSR